MTLRLSGSFVRVVILEQHSGLGAWRSLAEFGHGSKRRNHPTLMSENR